MFFILNRIDYLDPDERRRAADFLRKVLSGTALLGPEGQYFAYWCAKGLTANGETTVMAWREVGLPVWRITLFTISRLKRLVHSRRR